MSGKDLLKQAIAEAKTIREAAIVNAKEALEESLTPHLKEMLAQKLQEMEQEDEETEAVDETIFEVEEDAPETEEDGETQDTEEEDVELEDMSMDDLKNLIKDIVAQETSGLSGEEDTQEDETGEAEADDMEGSDDEINISELLSELDEQEEESIEEYGEGTMKEPSDSAAAGAEELKKMINKLATATGKKYDDISNFLYGGKKLTPPEMGGFAEQSEELNEALTTIKGLTKQLQEMNLLNAKLLYVNKVFKASNLTESQKANIVSAFDEAETVREVKLVFETVSKNVVAKKPSTIKEHVSFASKATGVAPTKGNPEIISEANEQVLRMQKLAGIIK